MNYKLKKKNRSWSMSHIRPEKKINTLHISDHADLW